MTVPEPGWLLLTHHLPPQPPYLRAKVMRRVVQLGALPLKRSAYLLPAGDDTLEDLQWLSQEIRNEGGDAWIVEGRFVGGLTGDEIRLRFRALRASDYVALAGDARAVLERMRARATNETVDDSGLDTDRRRLARRLAALQRIDFFHAEGRDETEALMAAIDRLAGPRDHKRPAAREGVELRARTWITRPGVKVDRMASAWLIRRFIDPAATFVFATPSGSALPAGALRFDMFEGEFTHDANRCTFEVLVDVAGRADDPGLIALGQIVHDIDLRDDRYQRAETAGVAALISGIVARFDDDHRRIAESTSLFDTLYASFGGTHERA